MEISIRPEHLITTLVAMLLLVCGGIGYVASPRDSAGRPVLLAPDVRAVETYRRNVSSWLNEWQALDSQLNALLTSAATHTELLVSSRSAQQAFETAIRLAQTTEGTDVPTPMIGLRDQVSAVADGYVEASLASARWVSAPTPDNAQAAKATLEQAGVQLHSLETNGWLNSKETPTP